MLALRGARWSALREHGEGQGGGEVGGQSVPLACELSDPARARVRRRSEAAGSSTRIICNAGIMALPKLEKAFGMKCSSSPTTSDISCS